MTGKQLREIGYVVLDVDMDDYYKEGELENYEDISAVDLDLFCDNLVMIFNGQTYLKPKYNHRTYTRTVKRSACCKCDFVVIEGLHTLNMDYFNNFEYPLLRILIMVDLWVALGRNIWWNNHYGRSFRYSAYYWETYKRESTESLNNIKNYDIKLDFGVNNVDVFFDKDKFEAGIELVLDKMQDISDRDWETKSNFMS